MQTMGAAMLSKVTRKEQGHWIGMTPGVQHHQMRNPEDAHLHARGDHLR